MAEKRINFEVMVLQGGRWEVHGSYPQDRQGQAIKDAKALENISTINGVKVIREEFDDDTGVAKENNIYASSNLASEQPKGAQKAKLTRGNSPAKKKAAKNVKKKNRQKNKKEVSGKNMLPGKAIPKHIEAYDPDATADATTFSFFRLMVKLLMVVLFSAIIAFIVSSLGGIWLSETKFGAAAQANILNALFFGTFFLSVVWMSFSFLSKAKIAAPGNTRAPRRPETPLAPSAPEPAPEPNSPLNDAIDFGEQPKRMAEELGLEKDKQQAPPEETDEAADQPLSMIRDVPVEKKDTPWVKAQKAFVMEYLSETLKNTISDNITMDNFNKFGVNLFIAGAIETLGQSRKLDGKTTSQMLSDVVKQMGFRGRDAEAFPDKIQGYLLADSKYTQMYQAGRSSMMTHLEGDAQGTSTLATALAEWNKPKSIDQASGPITVLFTDIAGSTNMTQNLGDALAQQVVRAHNNIVRAALHKFNGKEIKHTGDGIMASFAITSNAVEAAAEMQEGALKHSIANQDLPLDLKIGINAGQPIAEEDDLFGITVQLAARIVDKAQASQIFVSEIIQALCEGKNITFVERGSFAMKGIDGGITLYEVIWNKDAAPTAIKTETETETEAEQGQEETGSEIGSEISADLETDAPAPEIEKPDAGAPNIEPVAAQEDDISNDEESARTAPEEPGIPVAPKEPAPESATAMPSAGTSEATPSEPPTENETTPNLDDTKQAPGA